ncbi:putative cytochrome P450 [Lyophyllum shimeji]|uniref:Cytochrome P450 n=1 Tax=Lyophyllum shimeji TaxID=47721 RepID=A0A9P3PTM1_LYOSH|nr:putative cytochrome P450 [Lyophyllum shimeji]
MSRSTNGVALQAATVLQGFVFAAVALYGLHYARRRLRSRPPGPMGLPIVGNVFDLQGSREADNIVSLAKKYGDIVYLEVFGSPIVMLNGEAAMDLLDKRGSLYSDRPHFPMAADFSGMGDLTPIMRYGEKFQFGRRLMNQALSTRAVSKWERGIAEESHALLRLLYNEPAKFPAHLNKMAGSVVMMSMYGHRVVSDDDPYVKLALEFMEASTNAITGRWIIDFFPPAKYIPGLAFHEQAAKWRSRIPDWVEKAFNGFKANMHTSEDAKNSLCGSLMITPDGSPVDPETENRVKWIATSGFGAGLDVVVACLSQFIMAMALNPECQARAQKELDEVVGRDRLPTFQDRESLPYVECVFKETLRWGVPAPLSVPHRLIQDDAYNGYFLPAGTICIGNIWGILHDERMYKNPESFTPERFEGLDPKTAKKMDPTNYVYGFGRRRCPGNHFAHFAAWYSMASLLSAFIISPDVDENGNEIPIKAEFEAGAIRHTKPFRVRFTPRHSKIAELLSVA